MRLRDAFIFRHEDKLGTPVGELFRPGKPVRQSGSRGRATPAAVSVTPRQATSADAGRVVLKRRGRPSTSDWYRLDRSKGSRRRVPQLVLVAEGCNASRSRMSPRAADRSCFEHVANGRPEELQVLLDTFVPPPTTSPFSLSSGTR